MFKLENEKLSLINCDEAVIEAILGGKDKLGEFLSADVATNWSEFGLDVFRYVKDKIEKHPEEVKWWSYIVKHNQDNIIIGNGGFKGKPDENGLVEIGYAIAPTYRNKGFATEMAGMLIEFAFSKSEVNNIQAHTLAEENASVHVLRKCRFRKKGELFPSHEGKIWRWLITREEFERKV
ncbi:MAG: GNAT family N-acetyltransferase [Bacteroidota bacterium]